MLSPNLICLHLEVARHSGNHDFPSLLGAYHQWDIGKQGMAGNNEVICCLIDVFTRSKDSVETIARSFYDRFRDLCLNRLSYHLPREIKVQLLDLACFDCLL
jgi:hypothetical protein